MNVSFARHTGHFYIDVLLEQIRTRENKKYKFIGCRLFSRDTCPCENLTCRAIKVTFSKKLNTDARRGGKSDEMVIT